MDDDIFILFLIISEVDPDSNLHKYTQDMKDDSNLLICISWEIKLDLVIFFKKEDFMLCDPTGFHS